MKIAPSTIIEFEDAFAPTPHQAKHIARKASLQKLKEKLKPALKVLKAVVFIAEVVSVVA